MTSFHIPSDIPPLSNATARNKAVPAMHTLSPTPFTPLSEYRIHHNRTGTQSADHNHFSFHSQITSFSINQVAEDIAEEKMHSPRTPIFGAVAEPMGAPHSSFSFKNTNMNGHSLSSTPYPTTNMQSIQRTVSASSLESAYSAGSESLGARGGCLERDRSMKLHYAPSLSVTNSMNASATASPSGSPRRSRKSLDDAKTPPSGDAAPSGERLGGAECAASGSFGERKHSNSREKNIEAIATALQNITAKKQNGFSVYRHGLGTYSNGGSGANTNGTATPTSIGGMSRGSDCASIRGPGSECSYDDNVMDEGDLLISSGCSTPILSMEPQVTSAAQLLLEEDELETPVPTSSNAKGKVTPFSFDVSNGYQLSEIHEEEPEEQQPPRNSVRRRDAGPLSACEMKECSESLSADHDPSDHPVTFDIIDDDESEDEETSAAMDLEEEIILKGSRLQSSRILFLDVDGVLLSTAEQSTLGKGAAIKFSDDVTALMTKLWRETDCDVVISSTWQFHAESHLKYLVNYLVACGWRRTKIHTLLELLPSHANDGVDYGRIWYEQSPYCRCRARGIQKIVALYGSYITAWCALDDLPLHSAKPVFIPRKEDVPALVHSVAEAYLKCVSWRDEAQKAEDLEAVKYCVRYALTQLPSAIFSAQSYRFGYEFNQTMVYFQADAIAKCIALTREVTDNGVYHSMLQNMMAVMNQYLSSNLTYQGDPEIAPYLIQTDQATGITPQNIENSITLLTYDTVQREQRRKRGEALRAHATGRSVGYGAPRPRAADRSGQRNDPQRSTTV